MEQGQGQRAAGRETDLHQKQVYIKSRLTIKISPTCLGGAIVPIAPPVNPPLIKHCLLVYLTALQQYRSL